MPRMTIGPSQSQTPHPVRLNRPIATNGSAGITSATSHRCRLPSDQGVRRAVDSASRVAPAPSDIDVFAIRGLQWRKW